MKTKEIVDNTTNRGEFNRAYKTYLEHRNNGIGCSYCRYHRGENRTTKYYGTIGNGGSELKHPNWKLVSKNRKQWMRKPIKFKVKYFGGYSRDYTEITW